jgi:hypothetical protein
LSLVRIFTRFLITVSVAAASVFFAGPATALDTKDGEGVYIVPGSDINLLARTSNVPVQIKNAFDSDVRVFLYSKPTNPRIVVARVVEVEIPGGTSVTAKVPVEAVANGVVVLRVWLTTFSGVKIGKESLLQINVNADVELALLLSFGGGVLVLLSFGVARTVSKSRRKLEVTGSEVGA